MGRTVEVVAEVDGIRRAAVRRSSRFGHAGRMTDVGAWWRSWRRWMGSVAPLCGAPPDSVRTVGVALEGRMGRWESSAVPTTVGRGR